MIYNSKKSFTLIELLIVIATIGLLITIGLVSFKSAQAKARDSKRITEVGTLFKALELYYDDNTKYPEQGTWGCIEDTIGEAGGFAEKMKPYLPKTPQDPLYPREYEPGKKYCYEYKTENEGKEYKIHVQMETTAPYEVYSIGGEDIIYEEGEIPSDWYSSDWAHRKKITINSQKVVADLVNFPLLVSKTDSDFIKSQADGDDFLFTSSDGLTKLKHEIEKYDNTNGELIAWVKIPFLSSSTDIDIYIYYQNPSCNNQQNVEKVWDSDFKMVQHLEETPDNGIAGHIDSTSNPNNGTPFNFDGTASSTTDGAGQIDGADIFDGIDDYIEGGNDLSLNITDMITVEAWVNDPPSITIETKVAISEPSGPEKIIVGKGKDTYEIRIDNNQNVYGYINNQTVVTPEPITKEWHYIVLTYDGSEQKLYIDGTLKEYKALSGSINTNGLNLKIGEKIEGGIDEIHISNTSRSPEWIQTLYNNQSYPGAFISFGVEE